MTTKYIFVLVDERTGEILISKSRDRVHLHAPLFPKKAQVEVPQQYVQRITRLFEMSLLDFRGRRADTTYGLFEQSISRLTTSHYKFLGEPSDVEMRLKLDELLKMGQQFPTGVWEIKL